MKQPNTWSYGIACVMCFASLGGLTPGILSAASVPDLRGTWTGTANGVLLNCQDPDDNGPGSAAVQFFMTDQTGTTFTGTGVLRFPVSGVPFNFTLSFPSGNVSDTGAFSADFTFEARRQSDDLLGSSGNGSFSGVVSGNTMNVASFQAQSTALDTCTLTGSGILTRPGNTPPPIVIPGTVNVPYDLNGDGKADIVWRNTSSGVVAIWLIDGTTIFSSGFLGGVPEVWQIAGIGDVNGDGKADVIWRNSTDGVVAVWLMDGLTITSVGFPGSASTDWEIEQVGDVDGNGNADIVWRNSNSGVVAVWLMNGATIALSGFLGGVPFEWQIAGIGDVNGDGKADVIWRNSTDGVVAVWIMDGLAITSVGFPGSAPSEFKIVGMGDVDGNGTADVVWRNTGSGDVVVWLMSGTSITAPGFLPGKPLEWEIAQVSDTDGDGKADLIWFNTSTGEAQVWRMDGGTVIGTGSPGTTSSEWKIQDSGGSKEQSPTSLLLTINKVGTGNGVVTSAPSGINCGITCSASFDMGTSLTLSALPAVGSTFAGWSGGGCTGTAACTVTLTQSVTVTAIFTATLANISGNWFAQETVTATCSLAGEQETFTQSGRGTITIKQNGRDVSYIPPGGTPDFIRTGLVTGNSVQFSGKFIFPVEGIEINFTQNLATASGPVLGNRIDLTGTGAARGTVVGFGQIECTGNSSATLTR